MKRPKRKGAYIVRSAEGKHRVPLLGDSLYDDHGPFDPDELVRWATSYGHPEGWAKKAQGLHGENERLRKEIRDADAAYNTGYWDGLRDGKFGGPGRGLCDKCGCAVPTRYVPEYGANFCEPCSIDPQAGRL